MSAGQKALLEYETRARKQLGRHVSVIRSETGRMASATAQRHPYGLVAASGAAGLVLGALATPKRAPSRGALRRRASVLMRASSMWMIRKLAFD